MGSLMPILERTAGQRVVADFVVMGVILLVWAGVFFYHFIRCLVLKDFSVSDWKVSNHQ